MTIEVIKGSYAVCKLSALPQIPQTSALLSLTVTDNEISMVCEEGLTPPDCDAEKGFAAMRIADVLDFSLTGILAKISGVLADVKISIFAVSTFDTDYILVKQKKLQLALEALQSSGYSIKQ
ncbi:MAG: ACT domain-containing protein [Clostridia bacterium]|jgi:uncharacterized protein|nr:ACT domain-containing protein [Clostridia bacterium]MBT7122615.1 ACT domain-containing protein [Clostridia bacterium]